MATVLDGQPPSSARPSIEAVAAMASASTLASGASGRSFRAAAMEAPRRLAYSPGGTPAGSKALAPSRTATALRVTMIRSAPSGGSGSWAAVMRIRSPGERAGGQAAAGDLQAVVGRPGDQRQRGVPGAGEQLREVPGQVVDRAERADRVDARDVDGDMIAAGVAADVGQVGGGRVGLVGRGAVPLPGRPLDDPPAPAVLADVQRVVAGEQRGPDGRGLRPADDHRVAGRRGGGPGIDLVAV